MTHDQMSDLPSVGKLLAHPHTERLFVRFSRDLVAQGCRDIVEELRRAIAGGRTIDPAALEEETILSRVDARLGGLNDAGLQRVVNATGIVLHTHFGRALLPQTAVQAVLQAATQPINIEYDLAQGDAGRREQTIADLLAELTGAESATMVNNNTAALLLAVHTIAADREVIVSRADLAGDGGRDLRGMLAASGTTVRELGGAEGATAADFEAAIGDRTALLLTIGAGQRADDAADDRVRALVAVARARAVAVVESLGPGALVTLERYGLPGGLAVARRLSLGIDIVTFCGDKTVGGPQAGLVVGRAALVDRMTRNPLHRALRCDKLTIAALEGTLRLYRESADIAHDIPALRAITRPLADIDDTARRALPALASALGVGFRVFLRDSMSQVSSDPEGAGQVPTIAIAIEHDYMGAHRIAGRFRQARPPIVGRVEDDYFLLDARAVFDPLDLVPNWTEELEEPARYPL